MDNEGLKQVYDQMHSKGSSEWFGQGEEERELILKMGDPWEGKDVIEIGCGEGSLTKLIYLHNALISGVDYSSIAIRKAIERYPEIQFYENDYRKLITKTDRIVMQGVLEHLDDPFTELKWIMDNLLTEKGDVITSSPCFLNPRGVVWMTLDMLGAVMSKTDLHFLDPRQFVTFCHDNMYNLSWQTCDYSWAHGTEMIKDLTQRIPLALKDGNIPYKQDKFDSYMEWMGQKFIQHMGWLGATAVYKISK